MPDQILDFKSLRCPMPIVKLSQATKAMQTSESVRIEATDPAFRSDLEAWARRKGFIIREFSDGAVKSAVIEKG